MTNNSDIERHVMAVLVDNEPGVLARVIGLFSGRGYNIDSLTVTETENGKDSGSYEMLYSEQIGWQVGYNTNGGN